MKKVCRYQIKYYLSIMKQEQKKKRGGARPGSGRPRGTPTKTLSYRVPQKHTGTIHKLITNLLKNYKNENNLEHA